MSGGAAALVVLLMLLLLQLQAQQTAATPAAAADHLERGQAHLRSNQPAAAVAEFKRAIALDPRSAVAHLLLGQAYLSTGAAEWIAEAKAELQQARALDPGLALAGFYIAKIDLDLGRLEAAERELARGLAATPGAPHLLALLAEVRRRKGKPVEAVSLCTKALAADANAIPVLYFRARAYWDLRDEARARADLERAIASPFVTPDMLILLGAIHLNGGRLAEAEAALRKVPGVNAEARVRLAQVLRRQGRHAEALAELDKAEGAPQLSSEFFQKLMADAACERGIVFESRGGVKGARAAYQKALEQDPEHAEARRRLAGLR